MFGEDAQTLLTTLNLPAHGELTTAELPSYLERLKQPLKQINQPILLSGQKT